MLTYRVDSADRIADIGGPWDEFAAANGAPGLTRDSVLGKRLLTFVSGLEVQEITKILLAQARGGASLSLKFRCDSPSERRHLKMTLSAAPDGTVLLRTKLLRAEPRSSHLVLESGTARSERVLIVCSWCKKVRLSDGSWAEVDVAVEAEGLLEGGDLPQLSHGICQPCRELVRGRRPGSA
jgi:hypothetical protein